MQTVGERVRLIRETFGLSRRAFAERLGCSDGEILNVEYDRLKKPEQKESLYRNIAAEFNVSLAWIKTGEGEMIESESKDNASAAFGRLASLHDPVIDGFALWLDSRTPEEREKIADQLEDCVEFIRRMKQGQTED